MKKAEEYFEETDWEDYIMGCLPPYRVKSIIKKVQEDTIRETVKECAENATTELTSTCIRVDKNSILSIADKLIKEL